MRAGTALRAGRAVAGPAAITAAVLIVLRGFAFEGHLSSQHPDILAFWLPTYRMLGQALAHGRVPVWNPSVMTGVPFAADPQSGWMYVPAMTLFALLRPGTAMGWMITVQPLLAGLGLYWFARSEDLSRAAGAVGGLALALGLAASRLALFLPFPSAFAWTMVTVAAASRLMRARGWRDRFVWVLLTALAWGQLLAAHSGHGAILGTTALVSFLVAKAASSLRAGAVPGRTLAAVLATLAVALPLVNLAFLLPRVAYLGETSYGPAYARSAQTTWLPPTWPLKLATVPGTYVGALVLVLAMAALWSRRHRALALAFGLWAAGAYVLSLHGVVTTLSARLRDVPLLDLYRHYPGRFGMALFVAIPVLATIGVQAWLDASTLRQRLLMLVPGAALWLVATPLLARSVRHLAMLAAGAVAGGAALWLAHRFGARASVAIPAVLAVELTVAGLLGQGERPYGLAPADLRAPFGADPAGWTAPLRAPNVDAGAYLRPTPLARALEDAPGRYISLDPSLQSRRGYLERQAPTDWGMLANQRSMLFGLQDGQGYNPFQLLRYWTLVRALDRRPIDYNAAFLVRPSVELLHLLDVRWVVAASGRPPIPGAVTILRDGRWALYRVPGPASRVVLFGSWTTAPPGRSLSTVTSSGFDPDRELVIEQAGPGRRAGSRPERRPAGVRLGPRSASSLTFTVEAAGPSMALVKQAWEEHWSATVDGRPAPLLRADYVMEAVPVPPGRHVVRLVDRDPTILEGVALSALAVIALLGAAALALWRGLKDGT